MDNKGVIEALVHFINDDLIILKLSKVSKKIRRCILPTARWEEMFIKERDLPKNLRVIREGYFEKVYLFYQKENVSFTLWKPKKARKYMWREIKRVENKIIK